MGRLRFAPSNKKVKFSLRSCSCTKSSLQLRSVDVTDGVQQPFKMLRIVRMTQDPCKGALQLDPNGSFVELPVALRAKRLRRLPRIVFNRRVFPDQVSDAGYRRRIQTSQNPTVR